MTPVTKTAAEIRREFIEFFQAREHTFVPSSRVVPHDDPTLLFANAGMNQFKPLFLGQADLKSSFGRLKRAANTQKCIRAGGKHNDLDDVGHDTYHHTFFEMLGNWSFGDYFKKEAIAWAWELLTEVWGLDKTRLHATYFGGDAAEHLEPDTEARDLWLATMQAAGLDASHVHAGNKKDNFWEMGETGPCGPCSEIHIDLTPDKSGAKLVNAGDARVMEIWNLVFIQFNRGSDKKLTPLPAKHVDTGMGFERVTSVIQGIQAGRLGQFTNYDTDVFTPIFAAIQKVTGAPAYGRRVAQASNSTPSASTLPQPLPEREGSHGATDDTETLSLKRDIAYRVIADHIRTLTFAITDGAVPDKEARGYVLRRILRRAVRYGWQYLDQKKPFLHELVDTVVATMGDAFPELKINPQHVKDVIREEEESFGRTLERGIELFEEAAEYARSHHHGEIRGQDAFKLHDTYGFPIDLTQIMAQEKGLAVNIGEYERLMEEAKSLARAAGKTGGAAIDVPADLVKPYGPTDAAPKYATDQMKAEVRAIVRFVDNAPKALEQRGTGIKPGDDAAIITDHTCFYAEAGGQVGDKGVIGGPSIRFDVTDTQLVGDVVLHYGTLVMGEIAVGDTVELQVDAHRADTMKNHTGTHIMNWALREVLGEHVQQKGSLVDPEKTRFDFSHPKALTPDEIERVETLVNDKIRANLPVSSEEVGQQEALKINGLRAVFGERYPDRVRVLSVGVPVGELLSRPDNPAWRQASIEFCGGTHVRQTGDIEHFVIASEEAVAKGVRRLVGLTGPTAALIDECGAALVQRAEDLRRAPATEVPSGLAELQSTLTGALIPARHRTRLRALMEELQKVAKDAHKSTAADAADEVRKHVTDLLAGAEKLGATTVVVGELPNLPVEQLKTGADMIKQKAGSAAILFGVQVPPSEDGKQPAKVVLLAAMTDDLIKKGVKAGDLVKLVAPIVGGGGGGPPTMAQAGGKQPEKLPEALAAGKAWIAQKLPN